MIICAPFGGLFGRAALDIRYVSSAASDGN